MDDHLAGLSARELRSDHEHRPGHHAHLRSGAVSGGALSLRYADCGWFGSDVHTNLSAYTHLLIRIKGAAGGEQSHFHLALGGVTKVFGDFTLDGGGRPALTTAYRDIRIPLADNGIDRASHCRSSPARTAASSGRGACAYGTPARRIAALIDRL
ncbi:hypothetical protein [Nonomuraea candida]|uniref:hypothetical protein n=1 Tax=Nonomuraea candida TaxID=359159 RepID=UPI0005B96DA0|nr:hypothetical protein [Nonomuraea candida]